MWFLPATPMLGDVAHSHQTLSRKILSTYGLDYMVELVCGPRFARALHMIIFNRSDPEECQRANECYAALVAAYDEACYPMNRTPTHWQEAGMERLPDLQRISNAIKNALDPQGTIAPGRYGIG